MQPRNHPPIPSSSLLGALSPPFVSAVASSSTPTFTRRSLWGLDPAHFFSFWTERRNSPRPLNFSFFPHTSIVHLEWSKWSKLIKINQKWWKKWSKWLKKWLKIIRNWLSSGFRFLYLIKWKKYELPAGLTLTFSPSPLPLSLSASSPSLSPLLMSWNTWCSLLPPLWMAILERPLTGQ